MTKLGDVLYAKVIAPNGVETAIPLVVNDIFGLSSEGEMVGFEGVSKPGMGPAWQRWFFYPEPG